jgi:UPF0755 protein
VKRIWRLLLSSVLLALLAVIVMIVGYGYWAGTRPIDPGAESYVITPGSGALQLAQQLIDRDVIDEPYTLIAWAYIKGYTRNIKAGEYRFEPGISLQQLLDQTVEGKVVQYEVTFIEGWTFKQFRAALQSAPGLQQTFKEMSHHQVMELVGASPQHFEGRFYPDTYFYTAGTSDLDILRHAYRRMEARLAHEWKHRPDDTTLRSSHEALVLASIIEKETGRRDERRLISAVFHNRLQRGMRLQTDPTVIYGLGENFDGNLTRKHLQTETPYNTYVHKGLPPTPIAMPGGDAIHAALHPADTTALYFVARGDGSHEFSSTLEAHNQAVAQYQLGGRATLQSVFPATKRN